MPKVNIYLCLTATLALIIFAQVVHGVPSYIYDGFGENDFALDGPSDGNREELNVDQLLPGVDKRSCIRRGAWCDSRPNDCCSGGACRCNLWGTNCHCQRMGIFQKWG